MRKALLVLTLVCLPLIAFAAENPWAGTWKLDVSKSHFTGTTFSYSKTADGKMKYDDGGPEPFVFVVDGKPYFDTMGFAHIWTSGGPNVWDSVTKKDDKELVRAHRVLSPDGKIFTMTYTGTRPDGTTFRDTSTYTRVSGDRSLEGTWRSTKVTISSPDVWIISYPTPDTFRWETPAYKMVMTGKMDGSAVHVTSPTFPASASLSVMQDSATKLTSTFKNNGKTAGITEDSLSADAKTITEESWTPGKESEKQTAIYVKE